MKSLRFYRSQVDIKHTNSEHWDRWNYLGILSASVCRQKNVEQWCTASKQQSCFQQFCCNLLRITILDNIANNYVYQARHKIVQTCMLISSGEEVERMNTEMHLLWPALDVIWMIYTCQINTRTRCRNV
jgi:hypothetical protein